MFGSTQFEKFMSMVKTRSGIHATTALPEYDERAPLFNRWLASHGTAAPISSNQSSLRLPFQRWFKFKEAFSPRFILDCIQSMESSPRSCLDPFGGSGTTALTCQFLGIRPTTIEVNPFLCDVITAKLTSYNLMALKHDYLGVLEGSRTISVDVRVLLHDAPETMVEPGRDGRWIFSTDAAKRILAIRTAIDLLAIENHRSVLRVALASILVSLSNVVVNGKGRKYRLGWRTREKSGHDVDIAFRAAFLEIYSDLSRFSERPMREYLLHQGDSRQRLADAEEVDVMIFSPPYPNSFDYTDIYNLELWMLGYLRTRTENSQLRTRTLRSHVQIKRDFGADELQSKELRRIYGVLCKRRSDLWDPAIAEMICAYFADMTVILRQLRAKLRHGGRAFLAVGDSKYAGIVVDSARILAELAPVAGLRCVSSSPIRSMRASAQQGGRVELQESLMIFA